jgi:hypothetical protein
MIGGLIKQQYIRLGNQRPCEQRPPSPTPRQCTELRRKIEAETRTCRGDPMIDFPAVESCRQACGHYLADGRIGCAVEILRKQCNSRTGADPDLAVIGHRKPREQTQQRGLALAVATDQADALPRLDLQRDMIEQRSRAKGQRHVIETQQHVARSARRHGQRDS